MKKFISIVLILALTAGVLSFSAAAKGAFLYGDVDSDGSINSSDALEVLKCSTKLVDFSRSQKALADVDMDGAVNSSDALEILKYSVKLADGFKKNYEKTLKYTKVDSVINTGKYTIRFNSVVEDKDTTFIFTSNGSEKAISSSVKINLREMVSDVEGIGAMIYLIPSGEIPVEIRFYTDKNGKSYMIFPMFKSYCEVDEDIMPSQLAEMLFATENLYESCSETVLGGKTLTEEAFILDTDSTISYKFTNSSLDAVELIQDNETTVFDIESFSASADSSIIGIPSGYRYSEQLAESLGY